MLLCIACASTRAQDDVGGVVADSCSGGNNADQAPSAQRDFGNLCHYRAQNVALMASGTPPRVVFMGDSITEFWGNLDPSFFTHGKVDRGISGQTTSQMLLRFRQDVIDLHPQAVHIMAGTNDVAGNTGPVTLAQVEGNIASMAELAKAHGIRVMLASIPPAAHFPWRPQMQPAQAIRTLNAWIRDYAARNSFVYVDYYSDMATAEGGMKEGLAGDGVHPTLKGYQRMESLAELAMQKVM